MSSPGNSTSDTTPLSTSAMLSDPYAVYDQLRSTDPVHWHEPFGAWILTRHDDVVAAFQDFPEPNRLAEPNPEYRPNFVLRRLKALPLHLE
jgi:cytochrome P450